MYSRQELQMKRIAVAILLTLVAAGPVAAGQLPEEIGYTIYVLGKRAGHSRMHVTYAGDTVTLESNTRIDFDGYKLSYESKTVADAKTYQVRSFEFSGNKAGTPIEGNVRVEDDAVSGRVVAGEYPQEGIRRARHGAIVFLEDYVMSHEVLIARFHAGTGKREAGYDVFQPSSFMMGALGVISASELAVESNFKEAICTKIVLTLDGGAGFASYYDEERGLPVYLAFLGTQTEVFLDEFYGDEPVTRYRE